MVVNSWPMPLIFTCVMAAPGMEDKAPGAKRADSQTIAGIKTLNFENTAATLLRDRFNLYGIA